MQKESGGPYKSDVVCKWKASDREDLTNLDDDVADQEKLEFPSKVSDLDVLQSSG